MTSQPGPIVADTGIPHAHTITAAAAPEGETFHNVLRRPRNLRVKVVDIRSGAPSRNHDADEVMIDGEPAVRYEGEVAWDTVEFGYLSAKTWSKKDIAQALRGLNYDPGVARPRRWSALYPAIREFREDYYDAHDVEERRVRGKSFRARWRKRILADYRKNYYRSVQTQLTKLGYPCRDDDGHWDSESIKQYKRWQRIELRRSERRLRKYFTRKDDAKRLLEARSKFRTRADGVMTIPVPSAKVRAGFTVKFSIAGTPIVLETRDVLVRRNPSGPTAFQIEQHGEQTLDSDLGEWGWRVRAPGDTRDAASLPQLTRSVQLDIAAAPERRWASSAARGRPPFQVHYSEDSSAEIVVFAMAWCQPIWDGFDNPDEGKRVNENAYIQKPSERVTNMHVVTMFLDLGGSDRFGGKGYGLYERRLNQRWRGKKLTTKAMMLRLLDLGYFDGIEAEISTVEFDEETKRIMRAAGENFVGLYGLSADDLAETYEKEIEEGRVGVVRSVIQSYQGNRDINQSGTFNKPTRTALETDRPRSDQFDRRKGHAGYDLHVAAGNKDVGGDRPGSPVYALHGGSVTKAHPRWRGRGAGGNFIRIGWSGTGHNVATYLHMDELLLKKGDPVRAGQIIGYGGNTGNFGRRQRNGSNWATNSIYPSHTHLNVGRDNKLYREGPADRYNRACLPHNASPLLLPCKCEVPKTSANPAPCEFGEGFSRGPKTCWAVGELRCPHMPKPVASVAENGSDEEAAKKHRRAVQAQLRHVFLAHGSPYRDPGAVDGDFGRFPGARRSASKARRAIMAFRQANAMLEAGQPTASAANHRVTAAMVTRLEEMAPILDHGFEFAPPDGEIDDGL